MLNNICVLSCLSHEIIVFKCTLFLSILTIKLHEKVLPSQDVIAELLLSTQPTHVHQITVYLLKFCRQLMNKNFLKSVLND